MKKLILMLLLAVSILWGCTQQTSVFTYNGKEFLVDTQANTITAGDQVYRYHVSGSKESNSISITLPDGSTYHRNSSNGMGGESWSNDFNTDNWTLMHQLVKFIQKATYPDSLIKLSGPKLVSMLVVIGISLLFILCPELMWQLRYGWHFKNAEPSHAVLRANQVVGVVLLLFAVALLFI